MFSDSVSEGRTNVGELLVLSQVLEAYVAKVIWLLMWALRGELRGALGHHRNGLATRGGLWQIRTRLRTFFLLLLTPSVLLEFQRCSGTLNRTVSCLR